TVKQVAERLQISPNTIYSLCETGELPHRRIGLGRGRIRIAESDLQEYLDRKKVGGAGRAAAPRQKPGKLTHLEPFQPPPPCGRVAASSGRSAWKSSSCPGARPAPRR